MSIIPVKTKKVTTEDTDLLTILNDSLLTLKEKTILVVTSKIVAITEGRVVPIKKVSNGEDKDQKDRLIEQESQWYLPRDLNKYGVSFTITNNILVPTAGIDESNANGNYVLWPKDAQKTANDIREYLKKRFLLKNVGVVITDSKTTPLRWGVTGISIGFSGFEPLIDYVGKKDLFDREFQFEKLNVSDSLASAAVLAMGEGSEQTPLCIIENPVNVEFVDKNPTKQEIEQLKISLEDDLYGPFLKAVHWKKGKSR